MDEGKMVRRRLTAVLGVVAALAVTALVVVGLGLLLGGRGEGDHTRSPLQGTGVAELAAEPPAAGERVEVDAYYSGAVSTHLPGPPRVMGDQVYCPTYSTWAVALTDRPFTPLLRVLNGTSSNPLPAEGAWLAATTPEGTQPGQQAAPDLPYRGRFRGYLGDPAFAACPDAGRIFVVEEVVEVYEQEPPGEGEGEGEVPSPSPGGSSS